MDLFFNFSGRIARGRYWLAWLIYIAICGVLFVASWLTESMILQTINSMITIVIFISSLAVGTQRLHDRGRDGRYIVLFYVVPLVLLVVGVLVGGSPTLATALWLIAIGITVWAFVELGCLRGTVGANAYGADPIAPEILTPPVRTH